MTIKKLFVKSQSLPDITDFITSCRKTQKRSFLKAKIKNTPENLFWLLKVIIDQNKNCNDSVYYSRIDLTSRGSFGKLGYDSSLYIEVRLPVFHNTIANLSFLSPKY